MASGQGDVAARRVFMLKYFDAAGERAKRTGRWRLPLAVDAITEAGVDLDWSDAVHRRPWTSKPVHAVVRRLERLTTPWLQTVLATRRIARADAVVAIFESQGSFLAFLRSLRIWPFTRPRYAVVATWLAMDAERFGKARRRWYRWAYRGVDRLVFFSPNQAEVYRDVLGIPEERLAPVPFGIDHEYFTPQDVDEQDYLLAVGRDRGRDWATLFAAVRDTELKLKVACRPEDIEGLELPPNVEHVGFLPLDEYRDLSAAARVVVVPTKVRAYPTGQTVLLEAMALARCCVVTDAPAMRDYVEDEVTALLVPPADPQALRAAIERAYDDDGLRQRIGVEARRSVEKRFNCVAMWERVADLLF
jgi:glycosyltransferase involved in cell wall biosynthesis